MQRAVAARELPSGLALGAILGVVGVVRVIVMPVRVLVCHGASPQALKLE